MIKLKIKLKIYIQTIVPKQNKIHMKLKTLNKIPAI